MSLLFVDILWLTNIVRDSSYLIHLEWLTNVNLKCFDTIFDANLLWAARYLGIKSPIPYTWKNYAGKERLLYGMNYAYGGTGVFKTLNNPLPNMTTQIDYFQKVLTAGNIYSPSDLPSSLALVSVAGNDYATFVNQKRPMTVRKTSHFCAT